MIQLVTDRNSRPDFLGSTTMLAESIERVGDLIVVNSAIKFPISGGAIACWV